MKEFVKRLVVNLNNKLDEAPLMDGKSPKEYRDLGKEELKNKNNNIKKDEESVR